ncbi:hypothetical protein C2S52_023183 [Perilla frutescens var. hirtella]|nr:hypothetical protein C2S52_023183 [Perilla frutescens var. hirtella]
MKFDFAAEDFSFLDLTRTGKSVGLSSDFVYTYKLLEYRGSLGLIVYRRKMGLGEHEKSFELWVWKEFDDCVVEGADMPLGFSKNGRLLFLVGMQRQLLVYDIQSKELKQVGLVRMARNMVFEKEAKKKIYKIHFDPENSRFGHEVDWEIKDKLQELSVTDYVKLLDCIVDSSKDVEILSRLGILENWLGDDEVIAKMVNQLNDLVAHGDISFIYNANIFENVNEHCRKRRNRWMAKLRRNYLNSPWAIISIGVIV